MADGTKRKKLGFNDPASNCSDLGKRKIFDIMVKITKATD